MNSDAGAVDFAIGTRSLLPLIMPFVGKFQSVAHWFQTNAVTAVVFVTLGMVGVLNVTDNLVFIGFELDVDKAWLGRTDAMLEGILNERDKE